MLKLWVLLVLILVLMAVCYCDAAGNKIKYIPIRKKKKHHHKYHLIYMAFTYLTFLAIKFKLVFFFGTIFAVICAGFKIFAFTKYLDRDRHSPVVVDHGPEKVYLSSPYSHGYSFGSGGSDIPFDHGSSGVTLDHPPSGPDGWSDKSTSSDSYFPESYSQGRNNDGEDDEEEDVMDKINNFGRMLRSVNITDLAFENMNLTSVDCKHRFVCETDFNAKKIPLIKKGYDMINDEGYTKYRTNETITSTDDCEELYPNCQDYEKKTHQV